jgi:uncharacterized membrane protein YfcA
MHLGTGAVAAGATVGLIVGMTGAGGGALLTPILILFLGVKAKAAVSTDLVATLFMRPVAGALHARRGTVVPRIVLWLSLGSVPAGFLAGWTAHLIGSASQTKDTLSPYIAVALLVSGVLALGRRLWVARHPTKATTGELVIRPVLTVLIGVVGGAVVGITSVGSGTLMLVALAALYPQLKTSQLVGTDLIQAIPLVGAAALGHWAASDLHLGLTASVVIGGVPGAFIGALVSRRVPEAPLATIVSIVILLSGAALLGWRVGLPVAGALAVAMTAVLLVERRSPARLATAEVHEQAESLPPLEVQRTH